MSLIHQQQQFFFFVNLPSHALAFIGAWIITFLSGLLTELLRYYRMHFEKQAYFCTEPASAVCNSNPNKKPKMKSVAFLVA